jgi:putative transcriptional regulator
MAIIHVAAVRKSLGLSQAEFGQLLGVHFITVSKWERGLAAPTPYQWALMAEFAKAAAAKQALADQRLKHTLVGAGAVAALLWLLTLASKG